MSLLQVVFMLALVCLNLPLGLATVAQPLRAITLAFTARDFMPAGCMKPNEIDKYWFGDSNAKARNPRWINNTARCPLQTNILDGVYSGHPDFEASTMVFFHGCGGSPASLTQDPSKPNYTLATGGISCATIPTKAPSASPVPVTYFSAVTKIVESHVEFHHDGLPKPVYCQNGPYPRGTENNTRRCGWGYNTNNREFQVSTTGQSTFDVWYRDDAKYSKRVGFQLELREVSPLSGMYQYFSDSFHPFNNILPCNVTSDYRLDCSNGGRVWPRAVMGTAADPYDERTDARGAFSFTTEMHSFFTFTGNETFEFRGDDDVYIYINEKLALDVGGLHPPAQSAINLTNPEVQLALGLTKGEVYALDIFHAERRTTGSNFGLTTSLMQECGVLDSTKPEVNSTDITQWKLVGVNAVFPSSDASMRLQLGGVDKTNSASFAFLEHRRMNIGAGFVAKFKFQVRDNQSRLGTDGGFAFVIHCDSLENLNGGSSMNFGFQRNLPTAVAVAFDFSRNQITMMSQNKTLAYAPLNHPNDCLQDNNVHQVEIRFYAKRPNWMEVYLDGDLFLQKREVNLVEDLLGNSTSAWVGFTSGFGVNAPASSVEVFDVEVRTVAIDSSRTRIISSETESPFEAQANGRDKLSFSVGTFDWCGNALSFGGFGDLLTGRLTKTTSSLRILAENENNQSLASGETEETGLDATVVDERNGRYRLEFTGLSEDVGTYTLLAWFNASSISNGEFIARFVPTLATASPTIPATPSPVDDLETIRYVGIALGVVGFVGSILICLGCYFRKWWRSAKRFVNPGKEAIAEKDVQYRSDFELDELQRKVAKSLHLLNAERVRQRQLLTEDVVQIKEQIEQIRSEIRKMKERKIYYSDKRMESVDHSVSRQFARTRVPSPLAQQRYGDGHKVEFNALELV